MRGHPSDHGMTPSYWTGGMYRQITLRLPDAELDDVVCRQDPTLDLHVHLCFANHQSLLVLFDPANPVPVSTSHLSIEYRTDSSFIARSSEARWRTNDQTRKMRPKSGTIFRRCRMKRRICVPRGRRACRHSEGEQASFCRLRFRNRVAVKNTVMDNN
jgi:hypothetical protein